MGSQLANEVRLRRFAHPEADVVWAAISALSVPLQHEVLRELASELALEEAAPKTRAAKVRKAVAALWEAYDLLGESPSVPRYRQLCELLPELRLPAESSIRLWLGGGWSDCLRRALLPSVSDGDFSEIPLGSDYLEEELHAAVRACAQAIGRPPFWRDYKAWVERCLSEGRPGRRPASVRPFERFGGFLSVCVTAGVIGSEQARRDALRRIIPTQHAYSEAELSAAICEVASYLELDRAPRTTEYTAARRAIQERSLEEGRPRTLPTVTTITNRQTWDAAIVKAGFEPLGGRTTHSNPPSRRPSYSDDDCLDVLRRAWAAVGMPFTVDAYETWRLKELKRILADGRVAHVPSSATICSRLGGWRRACASAIPGTGEAPERPR